MKTIHTSLIAALLITIGAPVLQAQDDNVLDIKLRSAPSVPEVKAKVPQVNLIVEGESVTQKKTSTQTSTDLVSSEKNTSAYGIVKDKRYPPNYFEKKSEKKVEKSGVGEVANDRISAYLQAPLLSKDEVKSKLEAAGFQVVSTYKVDKKGKITSFVFTDENLIKMASQKGRGFAASLRLLVDEVNQQISISNPLYVHKAFMQDAYDENVSKQTLKRILSQFEGLKDSKDVVKFIRLPRYKFMNGMPVYEEMKVIATGTDSELLAKAKKSKKVIFEQKLENGSVLLGVKLSKRTTKFVKKVGYQNAELLPYPILIEDGKAMILAPKYYIAVMYPLLSMSEFMTIATVPGAISKDTDKIFR